MAHKVNKIDATATCPCCSGNIFVGTPAMKVRRKKRQYSFYHPICWLQAEAKLKLSKLEQTQLRARIQRQNPAIDREKARQKLLEMTAELMFEELSQLPVNHPAVQYWLGPKENLAL